MEKLGYNKHVSDVVKMNPDFGLIHCRSSRMWSLSGPKPPYPRTRLAASRSTLTRRTRIAAWSSSVSSRPSIYPSIYSAGDNMALGRRSIFAQGL